MVPEGAANALLHRNVWTALAGHGARRKIAAIAYVSNDEQIQFGRGDTLVVDASDESIAAGRTSARVLADALRRGANLYSLPRLHSKVLVFDESHAVIGSANLSRAAESTLHEACWISTDPPLVREINGYIQGLLPQATAITDQEIERLLRIPVTPHRSQKARGGRRTGEAREVAVRVTFFKEVQWHDVQKYNRTSSTAGTGGGARDLRIPNSRFARVLRTLIDQPSNDRRVLQTVVDDPRRRSSVVLELWPPTPARPEELRLARFYDIKTWKVTPAAYRAARDAGVTLFYALELLADGGRRARLLRSDALGQETPDVASYIADLLSARHGTAAICGAVLHESGVRV